MTSIKIKKKSENTDLTGGKISISNYGYTEHIVNNNNNECYAVNSDNIMVLIEKKNRRVLEIRNGGFTATARRIGNGPRVVLPDWQCQFRYREIILCMQRTTLDNRVKSHYLFRGTRGKTEMLLGERANLHRPSDKGKERDEQHGRDYWKYIGIKSSSKIGHCEWSPDSSYTHQPLQKQAIFQFVELK